MDRGVSYRLSLLQKFVLEHTTNTTASGQLARNSPHQQVAVVCICQSKWETRTSGAFQPGYIALRRALRSENNHGRHIEGSFQTKVLKTGHFKGPFGRTSGPPWSFALILCTLDPHFCRARTGASSAADFYPTVIASRKCGLRGRLRGFRVRFGKGPLSAYLELLSSLSDCFFFCFVFFYNALICISV